MEFVDAVREQAKLRLALTGPSGSGKTYSALLLAKGLIEKLGGKIAVIDTERGSASLYSDLVAFKTLRLTQPYSPERFVEAMGVAESNGFTVLIIDSITHEWNGAGGCLDINEHLARSKYKGNTWSAWNEITPRHRAFLDAINQSGMHIIATMRSKSETAQVNDGGKTKVAKLGMKAEQRDGTDYEFTTVLDIVHDGHYATVSQTGKDRTKLFTGKDPEPISEATGHRLVEWLNSGAPMAPEEKQPEPGTKAPITPDQGVWDSIRPDVVTDLQEYAARMSGALEAADVAEVAALQKLLKSYSAEEQVAAWSLLDSKQRSTIKKIMKAREQEEAAAAQPTRQAA
jgi:energy-coupling factor transporter ATP-binding protein EcfA2